MTSTLDKKINNNTSTQKKTTHENYKTVHAPLSLSPLRRLRQKKKKFNKYRGRYVC